jgi:hypothetical protein
MKGQTASLCVRRAVYVDPETGKEVRHTVQTENET